LYGALNLNFASIIHVCHALGLERKLMLRNR
jgi:hypothetical protein